MDQPSSQNPKDCTAFPSSPSSPYHPPPSSSQARSRAKEATNAAPRPDQSEPATEAAAPASVGATNDDALPATHEDVLPNNLPEPKDDHACDHLWGLQLPSGILLRSTSGTAVDVSTLPGLSVIFCYPRTGKPKDPIPADWDSIPGARGCTPQACSFNRTRSSLSDLGIAHIFGLSTQDSEYQRSCKDRLQLRFDLLSDAGYEFCEKLRLPMFEWRDMRLVKRITLLVQQGRVVWVDYPVFPADQSAEKVVESLKNQPIISGKAAGCGNEE